MKRLIHILLLSIQINVFAQNQDIATNNNIWLFELTRIHLGDKWGAENELHLRIANWGESHQQFLIRPSVFYKVNDQIKFHAGYTYIETYPYGEQPVAVQTPENNIWEQITLDHGDNLMFSHRYRFEQRWTGKVVTNLGGKDVIDGSIFRNRFRYRLTVKKPIKESGSYFVAFNELWINFGEKTALNRFDQNWLYGGFGKNLSQSTSLELAYMWQVVLKGDGIQQESNNTVQFSLFYSLATKSSN